MLTPAPSCGHHRAHAQNRINSLGSDRYGLLYRHPVVRPHQHGIAYNAGMRVRHSFSFRPNFRAHVLCKALSIKWALLMSLATSLQSSSSVTD